MKITDEVKLELRRLHAAYDAAYKPGEICDEYDLLAEAAVENLLPLLDALAAVEAERDRAELAAREKCREIITAMADAYVHETFSYDPSTNAWETRSEATESYEEALRDAAHGIAKLTCEKFGHDWRKWNDITRQCRRCEVQEHGEHLRAVLAGDAP